MPARFADTLAALKARPSKMTPAQAIRNIETWQAHVATLEIYGARTLHANLGLLKQALQQDPIDGVEVAGMMAQLAVDTVRIAGRAEGRLSGQAHALGAALEDSAKLTPVS